MEEILAYICRLMEQIENVSGRNDKIKLLEGCTDKESLKVFLSLALDPFKTFGCCDFDDGKNYSIDRPSFSAMVDLADKLIKRELTGHAARDEMRKVLLCSDPVVRKWMIRIFNKELNNGISTKSVNKVFKNLIPEFEIGLCESFDYTRDKTTKLPEGEYIIEPKLDGERCICIIQDGKAIFYSRNGKGFNNTDLIEKDLIEGLKLNNVVIDGELMAVNWNDTISICHTQEDHPKKDCLYYHIFDILTLDEWKSKSSAPLYDRRMRLPLVCNHIHIVPFRSLPSDLKEAEKIFDEYRKLGYEGAVLKKKASAYPFGRTGDWIKWKEVITLDLPVVDIVEGTGKHKGSLGAAICEYKGNRVNVGSGFNDEERKMYWSNKDKMVGKIIEVKSQEITKDNSLRFPVFLRLRVDK